MKNLQFGILFTLVLVGFTSHVSIFTNNENTNILITVSPDSLTQNEQIEAVNSIKILLEKTSLLLSNITNGLYLFNKVYLSFPQSWSITEKTFSEEPNHLTYKFIIRKNLTIEYQGNDYLSAGNRKPIYAYLPRTTDTDNASLALAEHLIQHWKKYKNGNFLDARSLENNTLGSEFAFYSGERSLSYSNINYQNEPSQQPLFIMDAYLFESQAVTDYELALISAFNYNEDPVPPKNLPNIVVVCGNTFHKLQECRTTITKCYNEIRNKFGTMIGQSPLQPKFVEAITFGMKEYYTPTTDHVETVIIFCKGSNPVNLDAASELTTLKGKTDRIFVMTIPAVTQENTNRVKFLKSDFIKWHNLREQNGSPCNLRLLQRLNKIFSSITIEKKLAIGKRQAFKDTHPEIGKLKTTTAFKKGLIHVNTFACATGFHQCPELKIEDFSMSPIEDPVKPARCYKSYTNTKEGGTLTYSLDFSNSQGPLYVVFESDFADNIEVQIFPEFQQKNDVWVLRLAVKIDLNVTEPGWNENIFAITTDALGEERSFRLRDSGNGDPDLHAGDGNFSRYILANKNGIYDIVLRFGSDEGKDDDLSDSSIRIGSYVLDDGTRLPPNRIGDLTYQIKDHKLELEWTAPGRNLDTGKVDTYEIMCIKGDSDITEENFVAEHHSIQPNEAGLREKQIRALNAQDYNSIMKCAIRGAYEDIKGPISNIITANIPDKLETSTKNSGDTLEQAEVTGIVLGAVALLLLIIMGAVFYICRARKSRANANTTSLSKDRRNDINREGSISIVDLTEVDKITTQINEEEKDTQIPEYATYYPNVNKTPADVDSSDYGEHYSLSTTNSDYQQHLPPEVEEAMYARVNKNTIGIPVPPETEPYYTEDVFRPIPSRTSTQV